MKLKFVLCFVLAFAGVSAQAADNSRNGVAVFYFDEVIPFQTQSYTTYIPELIEDGLATNEKINILDREYITKTLQEQSLGSSDLVDPDTRARLGKILGAQRMIFGSVMLEQGDLEDFLRVDIRVVDTETSLIIFTKTIKKPLDDIEDEIENFTESKLVDVILNADKIVDKKSSKK